MKLLIGILIYFILLISNAMAIEIYNCKVLERTEYASSGYDENTTGNTSSQAFPDPTNKVTTNYRDGSYGYKIIYQTGRIIVKRKTDVYER